MADETRPTAAMAAAIKHGIYAHSLVDELMKSLEAKGVLTGNEVQEIRTNAQVAADGVTTTLQ